MSSYYLQHSVFTHLIDRDSDDDLFVHLEPHADPNSFKLIIRAADESMLVSKIIRLPQYEPSDSIQL